MELSTRTRRSPLSSTGLVYKVVSVQSMRLHGVEYTSKKTVRYFNKPGLQ